MRVETPEEGDQKNRERILQQSKLHLYSVQLIYMNTCLLGQEVHSYQYFLFVLNCHPIPYQPLSNLLGLNSLTHSLQIYCTRLTGPISHTPWAWACERPRPRPVLYGMLGQTHVNGWSRVIASQNGGSTSFIFPLRLGVLQWSRHLFNYLDK